MAPWFVCPRAEPIKVAMASINSEIPVPRSRAQLFFSSCRYMSDSPYRDVKGHNRCYAPPRKRLPTTAGKKSIPRNQPVSSLRCILHLRGALEFVLQFFLLLRVRLLFQTHEGIQRRTRFPRLLFPTVQLRQLVVRLAHGFTVLLTRLRDCCYKIVDRCRGISQLRLRSSHLIVSVR